MAVCPPWSKLGTKRLHTSSAGLSESHRVPHGKCGQDPNYIDACICNFDKKKWNDDLTIVPDHHDVEFTITVDATTSCRLTLITHQS